MGTKIHTTKKLEKLVKKLIRTDQSEDSGILGTWKATLFYVNRKKCWLITNKKTKYNVILTNIKSSDLNCIEEIFKDAFYKQLVYDGIIMEFEHLDFIMGRLDFLPTDNDRSMIGNQTDRLYTLNWWKIKYGSLENWPIKEITNGMNKSFLQIGKVHKMSEYNYAIKEMKKLIWEYKKDV